ncbi:MAG: 23S rRNA (pseudouridine(1915)-N(3))-methyltransferase RlmH [Pseudomonadota bacterium]
MRIELLTIGTKLPSWAEEAFTFYQQRLPNTWQLRLWPHAHSNKQTVAQRQQQEAETLLKTLSKLRQQDTQILVLDERGTQRNNTQWHQLLTNSSHTIMLVGGADGLDQSLREKAHQLCALGMTTLPHMLVPVLCAELVYRSYCLATNKPYAQH